MNDDDIYPQRTPHEPSDYCCPGCVHPGDLLTIDQAAEFCQVSPSTIRRALRHHGLVSVTIAGPRTVRIRRGDLDAWLEARAQRAPEPVSRPSQPVRVPVGTLGVGRARSGSGKGVLALQR